MCFESVKLNALFWECHSLSYLGDRLWCANPGQDFVDDSNLCALGRYEAETF
jgi:hypothetical protein